jgi:acyl-CoA thioester hydrolase
MRILDRSEIRPNEIDGLGHMNVRFYMERARRANRVLTADLGLSEDAGEDEAPTPGAKLVQTDVYCRYHREQFKGSILTVGGGVLEAGGEAVSAFYEIANPAKGEIAATFIMTNALIDRASGERRPLPQGLAWSAAAMRVELPDHGRPRTIDLAPPKLELDLETLARRFPDDPADPMSRQSRWRVERDSCDEHGFLVDSSAMMFGGWRQPSPQEMRRHGPMTFKGDDGHRLGWASLETRMVRAGQARAGDELLSIGAEIAVQGKVRHSRRWLFNASTGRLVSLNDNVSIALDLDARRSIEIPASIRQRLEARCAPEFA